jgi:hypothetical protein
MMFSVKALSRGCCSIDQAQRRHWGLVRVHDCGTDRASGCDNRAQREDRFFNQAATH